MRIAALNPPNGVQPLGCLASASGMGSKPSWAIAAVLRDGSRTYWSAPASRVGGQDQWSPRLSQALRYATRDEAEGVVSGFDHSSAIRAYEVLAEN